jgi:hypothetical protein
MTPSSTLNRIPDAVKFKWIFEHAADQFKKRFGYDLPNFYNMSSVEPNGMGPSSWRSPLIHKFMNESIGLPNLEMIGDYHDFLYYLCHDEDGRRFADQELKRLMLASCPDPGWFVSNLWHNLVHPFSWLRKRIRHNRMTILAEVYYLFVRSCGKDYFVAAKYVPCRKFVND